MRAHTPCLPPGPADIRLHNTQRCTLPAPLQVSLRAMFAEGQAYVALSRARSLEGLQITDFDPNCVKVRGKARGRV